MSAEFFLGYVGVRIPVEGAKLDALDDRRNPLYLAAREQGLECFLADAGGEGQEYYLFVGQAKLGIEDASHLELNQQVLDATFNDVRVKLAAMHIDEEPQLCLQWFPDN